MGNKIDSTTAENEVKGWIKALKLNPVKISKLKEESETVQLLIEEGMLVIDGVKATLTLFEPVGDKGQYTDLIFSGKKLTVKEIMKLSGKGTADEKSYKLMQGMIENLVPINYLEDIVEDFANATAVMAFFLPK